jgi:hypothetical protein
VLDDEKLRNFDKLSFEELAELTGQSSTIFINDSFPFNINLSLKGSNVDTLISELIHTLKDKGYCKRTQRLDAHLRVILANLIKGEEVYQHRYPFYSRHPNNYKYIRRYNPLNINFKPLITCIDALVKLKFIKNYIGFYNSKTKRGKQSRIVIINNLFNLLEKHHVKKEQLYTLPIDPIRLKDTKGLLTDYKDTDAINKKRGMIEKHNKILAKSTITLSKNPDTHRNRIVDFSNHSYHRIFNHNSFSLHGRFYGPWWQSLKSHERKHIKINEEAVVELDYGSLHVHLAYSKLGIDYGQDNDPYSIKGIDTKYREVIKLATLTSLNMKNAKYFSQTMTKRLQEDGLYIPNVPYKDIKTAILKKHHPIKEFFFSGVGLELMYVDSCITEYIMKKFTTKKIPVLSIHDSYIVGKSYKNLLIEIMTSAFKYHKLPSLPIIK